MTTDSFLTAAGSRPSEALVDTALVDAAPSVLWLDQPGRPEAAPALDGPTTADLVIMGGGYTGLWTALCAIEADPGRSIVILEAGETAIGASGRNGGFCDASLTHGLENGVAHWPDEVDDLVRMGDENLDAIVATIERHGIDCGAERTGELSVAVADWQADDLTDSVDVHRTHGIDATLLDATATRACVDSPLYRAGLLVPDRTVMLDPARLAWGLREAAERLGVRFHDHSAVRALGTTPTGIEARTDRGTVTADRALVATNAFRSPVRAIRRSVVPVYDHVLATEPLSATHMASLGWADRQGVSDVGHQFHYYRLTPDDRILWGGWDALYHFGNRVGPDCEHNEPTARSLAAHLLATFPQLEGIRFTHRWGGPIATTTRFTCAWGTSHLGRVAWAAGYTGLGVGASRFGALVALDLVDGLVGQRATERTGLEMVRRSPFPFPPEPFRWPAIQLTRRAIQKCDERGGRRGPWLSLLDRFGIGFDS